MNLRKILVLGVFLAGLSQGASAVTTNVAPSSSGTSSLSRDNGKPTPPPIPPEPAHRATPRGNPGDWVVQDDYPEEALYTDIAGEVGFRLFLNTMGKVAFCEVIASSGFEILDNAACDVISMRASFKPARNGEGRPVADTWTSRLVWRIPEPAPQKFEEKHFVSVYSIDESGKLVSCSNRNIEDDILDWAAFCESGDSLDETVGLAMRGNSGKKVVQAEIATNLVLTEVGRDRLLEGAESQKTVALLAWRFDVDASGAVKSCTMVRQRGDRALITDVCSSLYEVHFVPQASADRSTTGKSAWFVMRVSHQNDQ
ncbi:MAG: energy transducer TonB [Sphingobium sp.]